jgi:hypothetical protein
MYTIHEDQYIFMIKSHSILLRMRIFLTKLVEEIKTHILFYVLSCHLSDNVEK